MTIEIDGVSLPDIPADVLAQYPYSVVGKFGNLGSDMYVLYLSDRIYFYADMTLVGDTGEVIMSLTYNADGTTGGVCYAYSPDGNPEWIDVTSLFMESSGNGFYLGVSDQNYIPYAEYSLVWANHDVLAMVDIDYTTFEPILGDVYFPDSSTVYAEVYAVKSDELRTLSRQVRRVCGVTESKITVDEMIEELTAFEAPTDYLAQRLNGTIVHYSSDDVTKVAQHGFSGCVMLESVSLPNATSIGDSAFSTCVSLESVDLPSATSIGSNAFGLCKITSLEFPSVKIVEDNAFFLASELTTIDFHAVEQIFQSAFFNLNTLTTVIIRTATAICKLMYEDSDAKEDKEGYMMHFDGIDTKPFVYVPSVLLTDYQANAAWSQAGVTFRAIEDYPDICGT